MDISLIVKMNDRYFNSAINKYTFIPSLVPLFFFLIYCFLPVKVSSIDGYGIAYMIREGEKLFLPHHLLYNFIGFLWVKFVHFFSDADTLLVLKVMNGLAGAVSLFLLEKILNIRGVDVVKQILWIFLVGSSWAVMRFSTENEVYILPVCFSLSGSLWLLKYLSNHKKFFLFLAGLFAAFAALIHQIHVFWWLGILIALILKTKSLRLLLVYSLPAIIVPVVYLFVFVFYQNNPFSFDGLLQFVFYDYHAGVAEFSVNSKNFLLTPVSFIRTFIQVHGYMFNILKESWLAICIFAFCIFAFIQSTFAFRRLKLYSVGLKSVFVYAHVIAFILHLVFAFISHGNAEFMVMFPFLTAIILSGIIKNETSMTKSLSHKNMYKTQSGEFHSNNNLSKLYTDEHKALFYLVAGLLIWNLSFGLIPMSVKDVNGDKMVAEFILDNSDSNNNEDVYILFLRPRIGNMVEYYNDSPVFENLLFIETFEDNEGIESFIRKTLASGKSVYTDCVDRPFTVSRASMLINTHKEVFSKFNLDRVDSVSSLSGIYYLTQILPQSE
ncbi:hypothetical protein [Anaerophaga thermohalophila]|uniref:hypothetical protein n=1 Tax=Anaerophaga thermohalophila TaxID=177400 RepID=UPI000237D426|nr:hypothetical protein [Anaerophaga thermohalophila]